MAIKIFYSILFAFIASSLFLFFKKPYSLLQQDKKSYSSLVEFKNINATQIDNLGLKYLINASSLDKKDELVVAKNIVAIKIDDKKVQEASSKNMSFVDNEVILFGDVKFKSSNTLELNTQSLKYNLNSDILMGDKEFTLLTKDSKTKGSSFIYDTKSKNLKATDIVSKIKMKKEIGG